MREVVTACATCKRRLTRGDVKAVDLIDSSTTPRARKRRRSWRESPDGAGVELSRQTGHAQPAGAEIGERAAGGAAAYGERCARRRREQPRILRRALDSERVEAGVGATQEADDELVGRAAVGVVGSSENLPTPGSSVPPRKEPSLATVWQIGASQSTVPPFDSDSSPTITIPDGQLLVKAVPLLLPRAGVVELTSGTPAIDGSEYCSVNGPAAPPYPSTVTARRPAPEAAVA